MPRTDEEMAHTARFEQQYRARQARVLLEIERETIGFDYGATSWTDRAEAEHFAELLRLGPGLRVLEVGAGSGWPGLYLARRTGADLVLTDLPREGLRVARRRSATDGLRERSAVVLADGARLPLPDASFDAVYHCDVLC